MRLTTIILIATIMQVNASSFAQRISLNVKNARLNVIMKEISKQTGYEFFYDANLIKNTKPVSIKILNATIEDALELCFTGQSITYKIENKVVSLKPFNKSILDKISTAVSGLFSAIDVSGRVIDDKENPLIGATVKILNTNRALLTDKNGGFVFHNVDENATLLVSYIGYQSKKVSVKNSPAIVIKLEEAGDLDEIQVIGYGQTTKRLNTGSVSSITATDIEKQPVTNVLSALSGRMPGVFVQTTNGLPGGNINIQIRGKGSLSAGTNPLYIIDGVPYDGSSPVSANQPMPGNSIVGAVSPLNNLNPTDIESITILKDADATSIYGSRGSNGVVLITTKQAKQGQTKLDVNFQQGVSSLAEKPKIQNLEQYLELRREAYKNDNLVPSTDPLSPTYAPDLTLWSQSEGIDWTKYIFGNSASSSDIQAKLSGGNDNTTFSVSGNYRYEKNVLPGKNSFQRGGLLSQFQHRSQNNKLLISVSSQISHQQNELSNVLNGISTTFLQSPNYPLYLPNGSFNWYSTNVEAEKNARDINKINNSITNLIISYSILPNLNVKANGGYTKTTYNQMLIFPTRALSPGTVNYSQFGDNTTQSIIVEPQIDYSLKLNNSTITFLAGATLQNRVSDGKYIKASNFKLESLMEDLASAVTIDARSNSYAIYKYASAFGRVTYNLENTLVINGTLRRDGSSKFGPGNRFGTFGSLGAAWIFSNLTFLQNNLPFLSHGKLRASYGTTGNDQIPDYGYTSTYSSPGESIYQDIASMRPVRISNADFRWETTRKKDIALELGLLKDRIFLSINYYNNRSRDQLVQYTLPEITGFTGYQANLPAVIENKGWEFEGTATILDRSVFRWSATFNLTIPKNQLKSFKDFETSTYKDTYQLGYDITRITGYQFLSIDQTTGLAKYAGQDGEASLSPYSRFTLGKQTPDYYGGFGNTVSYANFEFSAFAQFVKQVGKGSVLGVPGARRNNFDYVKDRWTPSNPDSSVPKATSKLTDFYITNSSLNIFDTSYLRLKNISLSYAIPDKINKKLNIGKSKLFVEAQNLITVWNNNAAILDPESGARSSSVSRNFPALKTFVFGFQVSL